MKSRKPIKSFRVKAARNTEVYYKVKIFDDLDKMHNYARYHEGIKNVGKCYGRCHSYKMICIEDDGTESPWYDGGYILLWTGQLQTETITHEAGHAALAYIDFHTKLDVTKIRSDIEVEEAAMYSLGFITSEIINKLYKYDLY